jgi:hypothetical protein
MLPISIGILSWNSPEVLEETLKTYILNGLFSLVSDITVLFQEVTKEDKAIARKYGIPFIGLDTNVGIAKAYQILSEQAKEDYFIFLEHDWQVIETKNTIKKRLISAIELLEENFHCVRLRSRRNPGFPLFSEVYKDNELNHYDETTGLISPHLFDCIHWTEDPDLKFEQIKKHKYHYTTTSRWSNWTNNPCIYETKFLTEILEPFIEDKLLEPAITKWWAEQNYNIAWGEGLFKHVDFIKYGKHQ